MNEKQKEIFQFVLNRITESKLDSGERLPTEAELARRFETNRMNAHSAIKKLESEGIVERGKKRGTVLRISHSDNTITKLRSEYCDAVQVLTASPRSSSHIHWDNTTLSKLEMILSDSGYAINFKELPAEASEFRPYLCETINQTSQALVIMPDYDEKDTLLKNLDVLRQFPGEIFLLDRGLDIHHQWPFHAVAYDPFSEGVMVAEYLKANHLDNICFLKGSHPYYWSEERLRGLLFGLEEDCGKSRCVRVIDQQKDSFPDEIADFIEGSAEKPVIVARNDDYAVKMLDHAREKGWNAPNDFFLIGFDNNPQFRKYNMTTVAPPTEKVGEVLGKMISETTFRSSDGMRITVKVDSIIIERETTSTKIGGK